MTSDPLLEVGVGEDSFNRANAMTILKDGRIALGTHYALPTTAIETVQVQGPILIQDYAAAVDINTAATPGAIRYDSTSNDFEGYVEGDGWLSLTEAVGTSALVDSTGASVLSVDENGALVLSETTASDLQAQLLTPGFGTSLVFRDSISNVDWGFSNAMNGTYSTAWGWANITSADSIASTVWGLSNNVDAYMGTVWGESNTVSGGQNSTVWGVNNTVSGSIATAWGLGNTVISTASTAWGSFNTVTGNTATAWGNDNTASGTVSTAWGGGNHAASAYSTAFGRANIGAFTFSDDDDDTNDGDTVWFAQDPLLEVGNGTSETERSNALTILKNGQTTVTNKAWQDELKGGDPLGATADPVTSSSGRALVVEGHAEFQGLVLLAEAQGDISMGAFGVPAE